MDPVLKKCRVKGCLATAAVQGFCKLHYQQVWRNRITKTCKTRGCDKLVYAKGLCRLHYFEAREKRMARTGAECERCGGPEYSKHLCLRCYRAERKKRVGLCAAVRCARLVFRDGLCTDHYKAALAKKGVIA